jgi:hypothetical protein
MYRLGYQYVSLVRILYHSLNSVVLQDIALFKWVVFGLLVLYALQGYPPPTSPRQQGEA